jgi:hypothetical protein
MFAVGDKVRLRLDVDRFPHFIARSGMTGVVSVSTENELAVKMDEPLNGAEEWDNQVWWYDNGIEEFPKNAMEDLEVL